MLRTLIIILFIPFSSFALTAEERLENPIQEKQAHEIFKKIRCVVCSGESINDSKADIAKSLRVLIREQVAEGKNEKQIIDTIVQSYGDSVLMKPPINKKTAILWVAPIILLLMGAGFTALFFRQKVEK